MSTPHVSRLTAEHLVETLGVGTSIPRLSWWTETATPGWMQAAYEFQVTDPDAGVHRTGLIRSSDSVLVPWPTQPLRSRQRCDVAVRVVGDDGGESEWSAPLTVEAGLLDVDDWQAIFVGPGWDEDVESAQPCPYLRRQFTAGGRVVRARLYVTALGVYEVEVNGRRIGDHVLAPGWTSYHHQLRSDTFDVTDAVHEGDNVIGIVIGDGWYRGALADDLRRNRYGDRLAALCQLELLLVDGSSMIVATDDRWVATTGPIRASGLYEGEAYDARADLAGWSAPGFDDSAWTPVTRVHHELATLRGPIAPPIRVTERLHPIEITTSPSGRTIVDFGQNLVGVVELTVRGNAGTEITLRHAEVLQDGELCTEPLRNAEATDHYVLRGGGTETWHPRFTFHGFRYAEVSGWPGDLAVDDLTALVVHTDMRRTGWFECSDDRVNRLHENVVWGMRGNFVGIPTDCPQRDERLGWTGDIGVFAPTASYLYDCAGLLQTWLRDLAAEQRDDGTVPWVVPDSLEWLLPAAVWGDAAVTVPSTVHQCFGDVGLLADQYESMRAWVELELARAGDDLLWTGDFQFADWLDPTGAHGDAFDQRTDPDLLATAAMIHSLDLLGAAATRIGRHDDATRYRAVARDARAAFAHEYVTPSGRLASDAQTAYALAIAFRLLHSDIQRSRAGERLAALAHRSQLKIATGFVGTPLICDALTDTGHVDVAYGLLLQDACPSWLYPVACGATTIWERWDAITADGRVNEDGIGMLSFNHYALGAVADWLHRVVGGLAPAEPGWRRLRIAPQPGGGLEWASSRLDTPYGPASSSWEIGGDGALVVRALVPPNTTADVVLPGRTEVFEVGSGDHEWTVGFDPPESASSDRSWRDGVPEHEAEQPASGERG
ncbi:MAG TPA: glycoside hydrolase family 78 protein [Acidimicrobiia bacterium]|nr:glycoside hydrolase family 78 protein [Acidimicrobiia bacterium]